MLGRLLDKFPSMGYDHGLCGLFIAGWDSVDQLRKDDLGKLETGLGDHLPVPTVLPAPVASEIPRRR